MLFEGYKQKSNALNNARICRLQKQIQKKEREIRKDITQIILRSSTHTYNSYISTQRLLGVGLITHLHLAHFTALAPGYFTGRAQQ